MIVVVTFTEIPKGQVRDMLEKKKRPLLEKEKEELKAAITTLDRNAGHAYRRVVIITLIVYGLLWEVSLMVVKVPAYIVTIFWLCLGVGMAAWITVEERKKIFRHKELLEASLARNEAEVVHIKAREMVEFEERGEEGAAYAFQVDDDTMVFVGGQDFYPPEEFPNTDFEIVSFYGPAGELAEMLIENHGDALKPLRRIPARAKQTLKLPGHLGTVKGKLADLEQILGEGKS